MGLDVGERRVGVAVSDPLGATAQPLETIERDEKIMDRLYDLARDLGVERVVVGLPLLLDGSEGAQARLVRGFAKEMEDLLGIPVTLLDERLSTKEAEDVIGDGKLSPSERREAADRVAAALILRGYLDSLPEE